MLISRHVHRRRRSAQFLRPAARRGGAAFRRPRHPQALGRSRAASACSASAMRRPISACSARRPSAASPSCRPHQGVVKWPTTRPALAALVDEFELPLPDAAVDRVLLVHALEMSQDAAALLREVWRVLAAGGQLLAVVPNRRGLWARMDTTPFGHGRPYSRSQITASAARDLVHAGRLGRGALRAADPRAAGSCARRWPGSAPARPSRRRLPACTSSRRPSRSIAPFRRARASGVLVPALEPALAPSPGGRRTCKTPGDVRAFS